MNKITNALSQYLPSNVLESVNHFDTERINELREIRLRLGRACSVTVGNRNEVLIDYQTGAVISLTDSQMSKCFHKICENSIYKHENEIKNGYITLPNGYRVGFCGSRNDNGMIYDISSMNIRISHRIENAADELFEQLYDKGKVASCLIVSEPCGGKTTMLTSLSAKLCERNLRVSVVDERGEIAACHHGVPQNDVGKLCDVLDNYPKGEGMQIALRTLSPQVLICDEVGSTEDVAAMVQAMNAGVPVIATAHAGAVSDLLERPQLKYLLDSGSVSKIAILKGAANPGKLKCILSVGELYENYGNRFAGSRHSIGRRYIYDGAETSAVVTQGME